MKSLNAAKLSCLIILLGSALSGCQQSLTEDYYLMHNQERKETYFRCKQDLFYYTFHMKSCQAAETAAYEIDTI